MGLLLFAGCAGLVPQVSARAADPAAGATTSPPPSVLGVDDVTQKTQELLVASGATRLEGLKPVKHEMSMSGMGHEGMQGMTSMPGADHMKMPGMQREPRTGERAGEQQHKGKEGMDHSKMPEMNHEGATHAPTQPMQSPGTPSSHDAHGGHNHKP